MSWWRQAGSPPKLLHKLVTLLLVQQQGLEVQRLIKCCPVQCTADMNCLHGHWLPPGRRRQGPASRDQAWG